MNDATLRRWLPCLLVLIGAAVFANALTAPFIFDDSKSIEQNIDVGRVWPPGAAPQTPLAGRPVVAFTMALNHAVSGRAPAGFRVVNVAIHLLAALTLYGIVRRTLLDPVFDGRLDEAATGLAFGCALLWMVHPLQGDSVVYITQRTQALMGLFYLLTVYAAVRARSSEHAAPWIAASVVACALGMASKESMVTAPVIVVLYDVAFRRESIVAVVRRRWPLYAGLAATWIVLAMLMHAGPRSASVGFAGNVSALTYALNQCVVVLHYLRLAVWPSGLTIDYGLPVPMTVGVAWPALLATGALGLAALATFALRPRVGFALVAFFVMLAPTSSFVPITTEVAAERRMYLPLAGLTALAVVGGFALLRRNRRAGIGLVTVLAIPLIVVTVRRNADFHAPLTLWQAAVDVVPGNARAHNNLANELEAAGRGEEAYAHYQRSAQLRGAAETTPEAEAIGLYNLGRALHRQGKHAEAADHFRRALRIRRDANTYNNLGLALHASGDIAQAMEHYRHAIRINPGETRARTNLGRALLERGETDAAIEVLREAIAIDPDLAQASATLGRALLVRGDAADAVTHFRRAIELRPETADHHSGLGYALRAAGRIDQARIRFERALTLDPEHAGAHDGLGAILAGQGRGDAAMDHFRRAIAADPTLASPRINLGGTLGAAGRHVEAVEVLTEAVRVAPDDVAAHENLGLALVMSGRGDEAITHLDAALARWPDRAALLRTMAFVLTRHPDPARRDLDRAIRLGTRAVEVSAGRDAFAVSTLARAHAAAGDRAAAVRVVREGIGAAAASGDVAAQTRLRRLLAELGG